ncbi:hypothetical protein SteCoe_33244 [Stentor coeruleus]|uniref:Uncharacterized protein n=1 Tax=Stentor coeruleus TaxID=5963 RepID=A0A1R2AXA9_9CILI|nr:hypothetical protein SteCoe_33244 [Stentor coeruleus]
MSAKHRRTPSAMPFCGYSALDDEPDKPLASTLAFDPPLMHTFAIDKNYIKNPSKTTTNANKHSCQNFFHNNMIVSNNDHYSFLSSSTENLVKEMNQLHDIDDYNNTSNTEAKEKLFFELSGVVKEIMKSREIFQVDLNNVRKNVKDKLLRIFGQTQATYMFNMYKSPFYDCLNEVSDRDTERRVDSIRHSGDTVEAPGSSYHIDDLSLVKFDTSVENSEKRVKIAKTRNIY